MRFRFFQNFHFALYDILLSFKTELTYRAATILRLCSNVFTTLVYIFLWSALYANKPSINGFSRSEMILFTILLRMMRTLYPYQISGTYGNMIKHGSIYAWLLKPVHIEVHLLSKAIGQFAYNLCFYCIPAFSLVFIFIGIPKIELSNVISFCIWFVSTFAFVFLLECCIGTISYYTTNLWGVNQLKGAVIAFLSGELLPLGFYPTALLRVFELLPFGAIYYVPISILLGKSSPEQNTQFLILWISILLLLVVYLIMAKKMQKRIMIQGG